MLNWCVLLCLKSFGLIPSLNWNYLRNPHSLLSYPTAGLCMGDYQTPWKGCTVVVSRGEVAEESHHPPWESRACTLPLCHQSCSLIELSYQQIFLRGFRHWHTQKDTHVGQQISSSRALLREGPRHLWRSSPPAHEEGTPAGHLTALWPLVSRSVQEQMSGSHG